MSEFFVRFALVLLLSGIINNKLPAQDHWSPQNSGTINPLYRVQFIDTQIGYAVGNGGTIVKTTDGGTQWNIVPIGTALPIRDLSFVDASLGWVATGDPDNSFDTGSVWHTTDGGATWAPQVIGTTQARFGVSFVTDMTGWTCGANNGPWDIRATTDGGTNWSGQSGSGYGWIYDIQGISPVLGWGVGVAYFPSATGFAMRTTNAGAIWTEQNTGLVPFLYGVGFVNSTRGIAVGDSGTILATTNGGSDWSPRTIQTDANLRDVSFVSDSVGWVCGENGTILKTLDGGATWSAQESGTTLRLNGIFCIDSLTGWAVGDSGAILKTAAGTSIRSGGGSVVPQTHRLQQNYPNPFNPITTISFDIPTTEHISLRVIDLHGREVAVLAQRVIPPGDHRVNFDASGLPSGVYFCRLQAGEWQDTKKMLVLK